MSFTLSEAETFLLSARNKNFYARVLSALVHVEAPGLGTMAVSISSDGKYILLYDPAFVETLTIQKLALILEHEVIHLIMGHIPRYLEMVAAFDVNSVERLALEAIRNVAADLADNEVIRSEYQFDKSHGKFFYESESNPHGFLIPEMFHLSREEPFEVYVHQLQNKVLDGTIQVRVLERAFGDASGNAHRGWTNATAGKTADELQGLADKLAQHGRNHLSKAVEEHQKACGTLPSNLSECLAQLLRPPTLPWPYVLRTLCTRTQQTKVSRGMGRPNRRMYGVPGVLPFPGKARDRKFTIAYCLDTSGSMSEADLRAGLTELLHIAKADTDITVWVMHCDADLHLVKRVESPEQVDFTVTGRGGTDFNPPFRKVRELLKCGDGPDILIYCTDGYAPAPDVENRIPIPVVWLLTPNHNVPEYGIPVVMEPY